MRSGGRHLFAEGAEGSKAVFRDCRDFLKQRRENSIHISSKINNPRISERLGPLPRPKPATNLEKENNQPEAEVKPLILGCLLGSLTAYLVCHLFRQIS
ncbi:hypothetical protein COP2_025405 [Malus domestica]